MLKIFKILSIVGTCLGEIGFFNFIFEFDNSQKYYKGLTCYLDINFNYELQITTDDL